MADKLTEDVHYAYTSITGAYTTALAPTSAVGTLLIRNRTDKTLRISFDGVDYFTLDAAGGFSFDFATNGIPFSAPIQVRHDGVAPTTGELEVFLVYR